MPWNEIKVDQDFTEVKEPTDMMAEIRRNAAAQQNQAPDVHRAVIKLEDIHRTDLPGCPRHRTAGAIQQHSSWTDPITGERHNHWTTILLCAECAALLAITPQESIAQSEYDDYYKR